MKVKSLKVSARNSAMHSSNHQVTYARVAWK
jgi:hypothetical protein